MRLRTGLPGTGRQLTGFVVLAAFLGLASCRAPRAEGPFDARVVGIADGDTLTVLHEGIRVRVRLEGVDCPERGQPFGSRAKLFTSGQAFGRTVTVRPKSRDRYGRVVADVVLPDGRVLNHELVAAGMAWHFTRYSKDEALARAEREARASRRGLWSEGRAVAPWVYRAKQTREVR